MFRDCSGERGRCENCISGPIMPRVSECLSARQTVEVEEEQEEEQEVETTQTCPSGCTAICVGPKCEGILEDNYDDIAADTSVLDGGRSDYTNSDPLSDTDLYEVDYVDQEGINQARESSPSYSDYDSEVEENNIEDYDYDYPTYDDSKTDAPDESIFEADAIQEEEEEEDVDINIDEGFLTDNNDNAVELPDLTIRNDLNEGNRAPLLLMFFVVLGGIDSNGSISIIDLLNTGLGNSAQSLPIAPLPVAVLPCGECFSSYTDRSITTCGRGQRSLTPYGYQYSPGSCYSHDLQSQRWEARGGKMTSFRKGASVTKLGRYILASGGYRQKRSLTTMEIFDPKKPQVGWRRLARLRMPAGVSEHCTVTIEGRNGKEVVITGGKEKPNRTMKLNIKTKRWYSLNMMNSGRKNHACIKARVNGHPGLLVSGGTGNDNSSLTSVEFYDAKTGIWLNMPRLRKGRSGHVMTITRGKLMVAGGERPGRNGRQYHDDLEIFNGRRWVKSRQKLDRPRSRFSLVKIPRNDIARG